MKNTQQGFAIYLVILITALVAVGGGVYLYNSIQNTTPEHSEEFISVDSDENDVQKPTTESPKETVERGVVDEDVIIPVDIKKTELNIDNLWGIYEEFMHSIKARDLDKLNSLSYEDYSECLIYHSEEGCWGLIEGMATLDSINSKDDITEIWKDEKQAILSTKIEETETGYKRKQLFFVTNPQEEIKILAVKSFSYPDKEDFLDSDKDGRLNKDEDCTANIYNHFPERCVKTDSNNRDTDGDGWWDGIEVAAGTNPNDPGSTLFK